MKKNKHPVLLRVFALMIAAVLILLPVVQASADDVMQDEMEKGIGTSPETVPTEAATEPPTEPVEPEPATAEELKAAWQAFQQEIVSEADLATLETNADLAKLLTNNAKEFLRLDVVELLNAAAKVMVQRSQAENTYNTLLALIISNPSLSEDQQDSLMNSVDAEWKRVKEAYDPVADVFAELRRVSEGTAKMLQTDNFDTHATLVSGLQKELDGFAAAMDKLEQLQQIGEKILTIRSQLEQEAERTDVEIALLSQLDDMDEKQQELFDELLDFFNQEAAQQESYASRVEALAEEVTDFVTVATVPNRKLLGMSFAEIAALNEQIEVQKAELEALENKLVFSYIALGVAALAVVMAIIASVLGAKKPKPQEIDLSALASREAAEALSKQQENLKDDIAVTRMRIEQIATSVDKLYSLPHPPVRAGDNTKTAAEPESVQDETPVPPPPIVPPTPSGSKAQVCFLDLHFQSVSPENSYLTPTGRDGRFILYDDGTVALKESEMRRSNTLGGWRDDGLFFLFAPQVEGRVLDAYREQLPNGYFTPCYISSRAKVRETIGSHYVLETKGCIVVESIMNKKR